MTPLRIVQVVPSLVVGGAETFAVQLAEALLDQGHDAHLLALKGAGPLQARLSPALRARTRLLHKRARFDASVLVQAASHLRTLGPDVVHTHLFTALSWGTVAARMAGVPVVVHTQHACHDDEYAYLPPIRRQLSRGLDALVGCSQAVVDEVARRDFSPHAPVLRIDNGIPLADRPQAPLTGDPPVVGTVGRLVEIKGQRFLIEAVGLLRDRGVDVQLVIMGDGPLEATLKAQVEASGVTDRVTFTGRVDDVATRLAHLDLFVLPSLSEALPIALLEAAAAGLPMVVTTGGGGPTLLEAGAAGEAVAPADAPALADAIARRLALSATTRAADGATNRALVVSTYDIAATASAYVALYRRARAGAVSGR